MNKFQKGFNSYNSHERGFAILFLPIILTVIILAALFYFSWQKGLIKTVAVKQETVSTSDSVSSKTENWITYTNSVYNYSLRYPPDWKIKEENYSHVYFFPKDESDYQHAISIWTTDKNTIYNPMLGGEYFVARKITVDGQPVEIQKYKGGLPDYYLKAQLTKDKYTFNFSFSSYLDKEFEIYFDQILSTLEFIEFSDNNEVDFSVCREGDTFNVVYGLGSHSLTINKNRNNICEINYIREVEGGYSQYICLIPKTESPITFPAMNPIMKYCDLIDSGNVFEKSQ